MGVEGSFDLHAIDRLRPGPAFGRDQHDHGPARAGLTAVFAGFELDALNLLHGRVEGGGHGLMHRLPVVLILHEPRSPAVAAHQLIQLLACDAGEDRRVGNLIPVEVRHLP